MQDFACHYSIPRQSCVSNHIKSSIPLKQYRLIPLKAFPASGHIVRDWTERKKLLHQSIQQKEGKKERKKAHPLFKKKPVWLLLVL
jgi:hypothetical protein